MDLKALDTVKSDTNERNDPHVLDRLEAKLGDAMRDIEFGPWREDMVLRAKALLLQIKIVCPGRYPVTERNLGNFVKDWDSGAIKTEEGARCGRHWGNPNT